MTKYLCAALFVTSIGALLLSVQAPQAQDGRMPQLAADKIDAADGERAFVAELNDFWKARTPIELTTHHNKDLDGPKVSMRAAHDGEHVYVMAQWKDATQSDVKKAWLFKDGKWTRQEGDEDRIAIAFNINAEGFAEKGCTALCHSGQMGTKNKGEKADMWHWKAARGGQSGWCDEQVFIHVAEAYSGAVDDAGKGSYSDNVNADKTAPTRVWKKDAKREGGLNADNSEPISADFKPEDGYSVPSILIRNPEGSRGDVSCVSKWADGMWTVVFKRKLQTGNDDDAQFEAMKAIDFAIAVLDNKGVDKGTDHAKSGPRKLTLK